MQNWIIFSRLKKNEKKISQYWVVPLQTEFFELEENNVLHQCNSNILKIMVDRFLFFVLHYKSLDGFRSGLFADHVIEEKLQKHFALWQDALSF